MQILMFVGSLKLMSGPCSPFVRPEKAVKEHNDVLFKGSTR